MRKYDDAVEVRRGLVGGVEAPEQFLWRGKLWLVHDVVAHWVETGAWWEHPQVQTILGLDARHTPDASDPHAAPDPPGTPGPPGPHDPPGPHGRHADRDEPGEGGSDPPGRPPPDLLAEREVWRVDAARGRAAFQAGVGGENRGVFDLTFCWSEGRWRLTGVVD